MKRRRNARPLLVCFTGMDGSGKTTQAKNALRCFRQKDVTYVHNQFTPIISAPLLRIGRLVFFKDKGKLTDYSSFSRRRGPVFRRRPIAIVYTYAVITDYIIQSLVRVAIPLARGLHVICDRYLFDTVVDLAVDLKHTPAATRRLAQFLLRFLPKPDLVFAVDAPPKTAFVRKNDIPNIEYLTDRRALYLALAKDLDMVRLDGAAAPATLHALVAIHIQQRAGKRGNLADVGLKEPDEERHLVG